MAEVQRRLQRTNKDQYTVTIPKTLVQVLGWQAQDPLSFSLQDGKIAISKISSATPLQDPNHLPPQETVTEKTHSIKKHKEPISAKGEGA